MAPPSAPYSVSKIAQEAVARYCARSLGLPVTIARMCAAYGEQGGLPNWHLDAVATGQPVRTRWDPMPYSPIHDDDIAAQLEPLLDAASVPATIVNWGGDEPVSVQEWTAWFGELLGVDARVEVEPDPRRVDRVGRRPLEAPGPHRPVPGGLARRLPPPRRGAPVTPSRYPTSEQMMEVAVAATGLTDFGPGDFREGLDVLLESLATDAGLAPSTDAAVVGVLQTQAHQPAARRAVVPRPSRGRRRAGRGAGPRHRAAPHRHHRPRQHALARPAVPQPAHVGAAQPGAATGARRRARRPPPPGLRRRDRSAAARGPRHAPLRGRRQRRGQRRARHGLPRPAVHAAGLRLPPLVAGGRLHRVLRLPPPGGQAARLAAAPAPVALQGAPPQVPPRRGGGRLPRRPLRDDPPRPGQVGALVRQPGVEHLPDGRLARRPRPHPTRARGVEPPARGHGARHRGAGPHRRGPLPRRPPRGPQRRPHGHGRPGPRLPRPRARRRRPSGSSTSGSARTAPVPTARTATPPSSSACSADRIRDEYDFYIRRFDVHVDG